MKGETRLSSAFTNIFLILLVHTKRFYEGTLHRRVTGLCMLQNSEVVGAKHAERKSRAPTLVRLN